MVFSCLYEEDMESTAKEVATNSLFGLLHSVNTHRMEDLLSNIYLSS